MRLSVRKGDPGHRAYKAMPRNVLVRVRLNGIEQHRCFTADTRRGFVLLSALGPDGEYMLNARRESVVMRRLHGRVDIELVRQWQ